jgi:GNAT superfamily N-acetyltransferase
LTAWIRRAGASDVSALAALRRAWTDEDAGAAVGDDGFEARFAEWFAAETEAGSPMWLAIEDGRPVGMATLRLVNRMPEPGSPSDRWGYVGHVYVVPASRNAGVGVELMAALISWSRAEGLTRLVLHPRERSVPFYERLGFRPADLVRLRLPG